MTKHEQDTQHIRDLTANSRQATDPETPVIVRVEIESMRRQLVHMISAQMSGMNDLIEREVNKALSQFQFDDRFYRTVNETLEMVVNAKVAELIRQSMDETFNNESVRRKVANLVIKKITRPHFLRPNKRARGQA